MAVFAANPKFTFFDNSGHQLSGGLVNTYQPNTTTAQATYPTLADALAGTNANANPIVLDSRGEAVVCITAPIKFVITDSASGAIYTVDNYYPASNGALYDSNNKLILTLTPTASAVNSVEIKNAATGNPPQLNAKGEANKGLLINDSSANKLVELKSTASAVNSIAVQNQSTGVAPSISTAGEVNIGLNLKDSNGNAMVTLKSTAAAVTGLSFKNVATGNPPEIAALGEANHGITLRDSNGNILVTLTGVSAAVNYIDITNTATGNAITVTCNGTDSNVGYMIQPKGTGVVGILGTAAAGAELRMYQITGSGTKYVGFKCPSSITSSVSWTLPGGDGTNTQKLTTNGSGVLSWT